MRSRSLAWLQEDSCQRAESAAAGVFDVRYTGLVRYFNAGLETLEDYIHQGQMEIPDYSQWAQRHTAP